MKNSKSNRYVESFHMKNIVAINKPRGMSSHDVVDALRRITGERCIGHAGTLDPLAEGVLVVGIGKDATKKLQEIVGTEKEYVAEVRLGAVSTTDDAEGEITETPNIMPLDEVRVREALRELASRTTQVPPRFSAVHIKGERAYEKARAGETFDITPRPVVIYALDLISYTWPVVTFRAVTGRGAYIRSLARNLGEILGVGGYITKLTRTRVGDFRIEDALTLEEFARREGSAQ